MYVVNRNGRKLPVDDSNIDYEKDWTPFIEQVTMVDDSAFLKKKYILQLQRQSDSGAMNGRTWELELVKELNYDHYPTKEEIIWVMAAYGLSRWDYVTVLDAYQLDIEQD